MELDGSGKNILLKVINNILKPRRGAVIIDDLDVSRLRAKDIAKIFGVVSQKCKTSFTLKTLNVVLMGRNPYVAGLKARLHETTRWP